MGCVHKNLATKLQRMPSFHVRPYLAENVKSPTLSAFSGQLKVLWRSSGPKGRRFKSCHLDQKMPESERIPVLFLFTLHKALSLALFSCNGCATLGKGPKTTSCRAHHFILSHFKFVLPPASGPDKKRNNAKPLDKSMFCVKIESDSMIGG